MKWGLRVMRIARWRREGSKFVDFAIKAVLAFNRRGFVIRRGSVVMFIAWGRRRRRRMRITWGRRKRESRKEWRLRRRKKGVRWRRSKRRNRRKRTMERGRRKRILCIYEKQGAGGKRVDLAQIGHGFAYVFEGVCFGLS